VPKFAALPNAEIRLALTEDFIGQSRLEIDEIVDANRPTWRKIGFGSISPLFGARIAWYATETRNHLGYAGLSTIFRWHSLPGFRAYVVTAIC